MAYTLLDEKKLCRVYQDTEKVLDKTLAHIVQLLDGEHQTVATAESCTGGLLSQKITSVAGASHVFELGLCTYAERMKTKLLGVPAELIAEKAWSVQKWLLPWCRDCEHRRRRICVCR